MTLLLANPHPQDSTFYLLWLVVTEIEDIKILPPK